jgi:hypothetical protein
MTDQAESTPTIRLYKYNHIWHTTYVRQSLDEGTGIRMRACCWLLVEEMPFRRGVITHGQVRFVHNGAYGQLQHWHQSRLHGQAIMEDGAITFLNFSYLGAAGMTRELTVCKLPGVKSMLALHAIPDTDTYNRHRSRSRAGTTELDEVAWALLTEVPAAPRHIEYLQTRPLLPPRRVCPLIHLEMSRL